MITAAIVILLVMCVMAAITLFAFSWAVSDGQFEDFEQGAEVIFDPDEPVGKPTDPGLNRSREPGRSA